MMNETESEYRELSRLAQKLKIPVFGAFLELEVKNGKGEVVHCHRQRSHSWVRNAYNIVASQLAAKAVLYGYVYGAGKVNLKDIGGAVRDDTTSPMGLDTSSNVNSAGGGYRGASAYDDHGIVVGSGTNAESFEDYKLQTRINQGNGAGQLAYQEGALVYEVYDVPTKVFSFEYARYFNNNSGGNISVNEVAIYAKNIKVGSGNYIGMVSRDKLGSTITVPDTGQLKVTYTIQLTYPA